MKFQTFSIVVGTAACNARCPFCISKMTGLNPVANRTNINRRNLEKAITLAEKCGVTTVILTGKGEPLLHADEVLIYADQCKRFPLVEIQTNGISLLEDKISSYEVKTYLDMLYNLGATSILLSNVGYSHYLNKKIYCPNNSKYSLEKIIAKINSSGLNVRLTTMGIKNGIDTPEEFDRLVEFAKANNVKQITWRPVVKCGSGPVADWVDENEVENPHDIVNYVINNSNLIYRLQHGGAVYDYKGMNICLANCLTRSESQDEIRQLIFYPDGSLYTDWELKGSVLL